MIEAISADGRVKVVWDYIGEGVCGDYDPEDPHDVALMRFDAYVNTSLVSLEDIAYEDEFEDWAMPQDSSYCTNVPEQTPGPRLLVLAQEIADTLCEALPKGGWKRAAEEMSWITA